eukprot:6257497-Alexandrium_andersonii.AAC.1
MPSGVSSRGSLRYTGFLVLRNFQPQTVTLRSSAMVCTGDLFLGPRTNMASSGRLSLRMEAKRWHGMLSAGGTSRDAA